MRRIVLLGRPKVSLALRGFVVGALALLGAVACSSEFAGPVVRDRAVRVSGVVAPVDEAGIVVVTFTGGRSGSLFADACASDYELEVDADADPPIVTVWELAPTRRPLVACAAVGFGWELEHRFETRVPEAVIDGSTGDVVAVIFETRRLVIGDLPAGWTVLSAPESEFRVGTPMIRLSDGNYKIEVRFGLAADPMELLAAIRTPGPHTPIMIRDDVYAEISEFLGRPQLRFVDGSYLYQLSGDQEVDPADLLAVAEAMSLELARCCAVAGRGGVVLSVAVVALSGLPSLGERRLGCWARRGGQRWISGSPEMSGGSPLGA